MKTNLLNILLALCCLDIPLAAAEAPKTSYVIGLSPFLEKSVKDDVYRRVVRFALEEMPLNSSLALYDAYHLRSITQFTIPELRAFQSGKTRANQFKSEIQKLKEFLALAWEWPATNHFNFSAALRLPQFTDFIGENLVLPGTAPIVVLVGNPLYLDLKEPGFSMVDGYFPSDGHLAAARDRSVYGLKSRSRALTHVIVHISYFGDPWESGVHEEKIVRFWSLYLKGQGAQLGSICGDLATTFAALDEKQAIVSSRSARYEMEPGDTKLEMLRITRDVGLADWITRDHVPNVQHGPPTRTQGPMKIGIRWKGHVDLDLYAKPAAGAQTLFFEKTRSAEGYYFKDHRSSPEREYEFIEFERPVDVWEVEARINFYKGELDQGAHGEVRIEFEGKIYSGRFDIPATHGNEGREGRSQHEFWTTVDIPSLLKLERLTSEARSIE